MKRIVNKILIMILSFVFACSLASCSDPKLNHTITLGDNGDLITNRGMGWNFCYYSNSLTKFGANLSGGDLLDDYPCDIVYFRIGWNFIQPDKEFAAAMGWTDESSADVNGIYVTEEECNGDNFHWDLIDPIVEEWTRAGKRVAFRITANDGWGQCTPLWVREKGAKGVEYDPITEGSYDRLTHVLALTCTNPSCGAQFDVDPDNDMIFDDTSESTMDRYQCSECSAIIEIENSKTNQALWKTDESNNYIYTESSQTTVYNGFTDEGKVWYDSGENGHVLGAGRKTWCPDYGDEIFLENYKKLLEAIRDRYGDVLEFIDIGSFGTWGEGHSNRALPTREYITRENVLKQFEMYYEVFGDDYLVIAGDTMAERLNVSEDIISYGFGCTDDSVQVPGMTGDANAAILEPLYDAGSVIALETHPGTVSTKQYYDGINECCASYARLIANPEEMKASEWTDMMTRRMGYRLSFTKAKLSDFAPGKTFSAQLSLKNTGAARCTLNGYPAIVVLTENGREICRGISEFNVKDLAIESDPEQLNALQASTVSLSLEVPEGLSAGRYSICICVVDEDGNAAFNLPLDDGYNMLYRIATFEVR